MARIERWIIYPVLALLTWAVFARGVGLDVRSAAAKEPVADAAFRFVKARRIEIVNAGGRTCMMLDAPYAGGCSVELVDREGKVRALLGLNDLGTPSLELHDAMGRPRLELTVSEDGPAAIRLRAADGRSPLRLGLSRDEEPVLKMYDVGMIGEEQERVALELDKLMGPSLVFLGARGWRRLAVGGTQLVNKETGVESVTTPNSITLFGTNDTVLWTAPPK